MLGGAESYIEGIFVGVLGENASYTLRRERMVLFCLLYVIASIWYRSSDTSVAFRFVIHDKRLKT